MQLKEGQEITITTDYSIKGDHNTIAMSYKKLAHDLKPQSLILCADGSISLKVLQCDEEAGLVRCRCMNAAVLGERKNVNLPGVAVDLPTLTEKDVDDIMRWGIPNRIDIIALSFVRRADDVVRVRELLGAHAGSVLLMAKVENQEGLTNFDRILEESDAFMVARGDLGMEIPIEKMFVAQKAMIRRCNERGKPVVTATQMLESMTASPRPTRAEATDVANAVLDGTDCVMLSGETAAGAYPVEAVETMARICIEAEGCLDHGRILRRVAEAAPRPLSPSESLACAAAQAANSTGASLIMVVDEEGGAAELVAKYRPSTPIVAVEAMAGEKKGKAARLVLRGVTAVAVQSISDEVPVVEMAVKTAKARHLCREGDSIVAAVRRGGSTAVTILTVG